jgi:hypothetical protein
MGVCRYASPHVDVMRTTPSIVSRIGSVPRSAGARRPRAHPDKDKEKEDEQIRRPHDWLTRMPYFALAYGNKAESERGMVTTVHGRSRGALRHLATWVQAAGLVYVIGFGMVLLGAVIALPVLGVLELVSWMAGLMR